MMETVRQWLTGIVAVSVLLYIVRQIKPRGAVGRVAEFTGSLVLLGALLQPLGAWEMEAINIGKWQQAVEARQEELAQAQQEALSAVIAEKTAAYILDKAPQLRVEVQTEEAEGTVVPAAVELTGDYSREVSQWIAEELGIGAERQVWHDGET